MSFTLAIDTATKRTGLAIASRDEILIELYEEGATAHGEALTRLAARAFSEVARSEIESVAVGIGPGPFTGLRVGIAFAQSFAFALSLPLYSVCTLDVIAGEVSCNQDFAVATDARRNEVYWARYSSEGVRMGDVRVTKASDLAESDRWLPTAGDGVEIYPDLFPYILDPALPNVAQMAQKARVLALADSAPLYLRRPDAIPPVASLSIKGGSQ